MPRSLLLIGSTLLTMTFATRVFAAEFRDVPASSPFATAFAYLQKERVIQGSPDGFGRPFATLTRAEGLKTVLRSREQFAPQVVWFTENLPAIALFPDMDQTAWYAPYVEVGFLEGVMTGLPDGTFRPGAALTVEQALVLLRRAYGRTGSVAYRTSADLPNTPGQWYTDALSEAIDRRLIAEGSALGIGEPITRGQFFDIVYRLREAEEKRTYAWQGNEPEGTRTVISVPSMPSTPPVAFPLRVTPLPIGEADAFVLRLPQAREQTKQTKSVSAVYASLKSFAITIPRLDIIDIAVTHPADPFSEEGILAVLRDGLGHLFSYPGSTGKTMIYGHSSSWPWDRSDFARAFRRVNELQIGERVYVTYNRKLYVYEVTRKQVVSAKDTSAFSDDGSEELILYTCWPPDSTESRYLVHAARVETVALQRYPESTLP